METLFKQTFGGQTKSIMVFLKVAYSYLLPLDPRLQILLDMKRVRMIHTFGAIWAKNHPQGTHKYTEYPHETEMDTENLAQDGIYFWSHAASSVL